MSEDKQISNDSVPAELEAGPMPEALLEAVNQSDEVNGAVEGNQALIAGSNMETTDTVRDGFTDNNGKVHDFETGQFKGVERVDEKPETENPSYEAISVMGKGGLLDMWASAMDHAQTSKTIDIESEILRRLNEEPDLSEDRKLQIFSTYKSMMENKRQQPTSTATDEVLGGTTIPRADDAPVIDLPPAETFEATAPSVSITKDIVEQAGPSESNEVVVSEAESSVTSSLDKKTEDSKESLSHDDEKALSELRERISVVRGMIDSLPLAQLQDELEQMQIILNRLKSTDKE
jgi:hypothetical protein